MSTEAVTTNVAGPDEAEPDGQPSAADEVAAAIEAAPRGAATVGRRRAGQPKTPRWMVAGKLRRGSLG